MLSRICILLPLLFLPPIAKAGEYKPVSDQWIAQATEKMRAWRGQQFKILDSKLIRNSDNKDWLAVTWYSSQTFIRLNLYRVDPQQDGSFKLKTFWDLYNGIILIDGTEDGPDGGHKILLIGTSPGGSSTEKDQDLKIALKENAPLLTPLNCDYMIECPWDKTLIYGKKPSKYRSDR